MFSATLFTTARTWKQSRYPAVIEFINKLWNIQRMKYYSVLKRNELSNHEKTWRKLKWISLNELKQSERLCILWFQLYMTLWKKQNYGCSKKISGCLGFVGRKGWIDRAQIFRAVKLICMMLQCTHDYNIIMADICHYILSKPIEDTIPTVTPNVNCGLWVVIIHHYRFIHCYNWTTLVQNVDRREFVGMWRQGACGSSLLSTQFCFFSPLNFVANIKLLWKII